MHNMEDSRVRLVEATATAFYDYYLAIHQLELNRQNVEVIGDFRNTAQAKYSANQVTQQDVLQADVEMAQQQRRQIELRRMVKVAIAPSTRCCKKILLRRCPRHPSSSMRLRARWIPPRSNSWP